MSKLISDDDEDLKNLFNRLKIGILVILLFGGLFLIILVNKFSVKDSKVIKAINNNETLYVLIDDNSCKECKRIKEIFKENNIYYMELNTDKETQYKVFLKKISSSEHDVEKPTIMYIKDGKMVSSIVKVKTEEQINNFIETNETIVE